MGRLTRPSGAARGHEARADLDAHHHLRPRVLPAAAGNAALARLLPLQPARGPRLTSPTKPPVFFQQPQWGKSTKAAGGRFMKVRLGPGAFDATARGSTPGVEACTAVNTLNRNGHGGYLWIKGHLLNENLGGPGNSDNLTPITDDANKDHLNTIESKVKAAIVWAAHRAEFNKSDDSWYGVYYEVKVVGQHYAAGSAAARAVGVRLDCRAVWIAQHKQSKVVTPYAVAPPTRPVLPTNVVSIACVQ